MDQDFLLRLAERVRELIPRAGTDVCEGAASTLGAGVEEQAAATLKAEPTSAGFT